MNDSLIENVERALDCDEEHLVIEGFMKRYNVSKEEAKEIFYETKKWLWLAAKSSNDENFHLFIDQPLKVIDEMWHTFILYTKIYYNFCIRHFNRFIHHSPTTNEEISQIENRMKSDKKNLIREKEATLKKQYSLIYDHLGEETLIKWYQTYPIKYSNKNLQIIRKQ